MSENDGATHYFLFAGLAKNGWNKLYIGRGSFDDPNSGWQQTQPVKKLRGENEDEIRDAAVTRARELFASAEDLSNDDKVYKSWDTNKVRAATEGPKRLFIINPWPDARD